LRKILFSLLGWLIFLSSGWAGERLALVSDREFASLTRALEESLPKARRVNPSPEICSYPRLLILGPRSYLEVKKIHCKGQKRYVSGILYPSLFGLPDKETVFVPFLPSCQSLKKLAGERRVVTIYSPYLDYYLKELSSCLQLKAFRVEDPYTLPEILCRVVDLLHKGTVFLILPDPLFLESRGYRALTSFLSRYDPLTLDLLGIKELSTRKVSLSEEEHLQQLLRVLKEEP